MIIKCEPNLSRLAVTWFKNKPLKANPGPGSDECVEISTLACLFKIDANAHYNSTLSSNISSAYAASCIRTVSTPMSPPDNDIGRQFSSWRVSSAFGNKTMCIRQNDTGNEPALPLSLNNDTRIGAISSIKAL
jgi:hypothetical protein